MTRPPNLMMRENPLYAARDQLTHSYLSPFLGAALADFPPTFIQAGTRDLILSNEVHQHRAQDHAGAQIALPVFEAISHRGFSGSPEDRELSRDIARFVARAE